MLSIKKHFSGILLEISRKYDNKWTTCFSLHVYDGPNHWDGLTKANKIMFINLHWLSEWKGGMIF